MIKLCWTLFLVLVISQSGFTVSIEHDLKGFDDSILFSLEWPGPDLHTLTGDDAGQNPQDVMRVMTANKEQYECRLPGLQSKQSSSYGDYTGPSALQLLSPLFSQKICSYRLESYWSYELCHGHYLRQYHEERDGKKVKLQEFTLGRWSKEELQDSEKNILANMDANEPPKYTKIDGIKLPYIELVMADGTLCDLSGKSRLARVRYVCYGHGKHEVYSLKETATCEYEVLILSPLLCAHPRYKPRESRDNNINCVSVGDAPTKPRALLALEAESLKLQHQTVHFNINEKAPKDVVAVLKVEKYLKDGETHVKFELHPVDVAGAQAADEPPAPPPAPPAIPPVAPGVKDNSPVQAFLNGENCLVGGGGWWKYEFCYGLSVQQYHVDRNGARTSVLLGRFDEEAHLKWIRENPHKAPKPIGQRTSLSHFYSGGEMCEKSGQPRQTEVKLKCVHNSSSAPVSLYLLEPRPCVYILGVEAPLVCDLLAYADDDGLVRAPPPAGSREPTRTDAGDPGDAGHADEDGQH